MALYIPDNNSYDDDKAFDKFVEVVLPIIFFSMLLFTFICFLHHINNARTDIIKKRNDSIEVTVRPFIGNTNTSTYHSPIYHKGIITKIHEEYDLQLIGEVTYSFDDFKADVRISDSLTIERLSYDSKKHYKENDSITVIESYYPKHEFKLKYE